MLMGIGATPQLLTEDGLGMGVVWCGEVIAAMAELTREADCSRPLGLPHDEYIQSCRLASRQTLMSF